MNEFIAHNIITVVIVFLVLEVLLGMLAQSIAEKKGHSKQWFWAGFVLSLIGVVWTVGLPDEHLRRQLLRLSETRDNVPVYESASAAPVQPDESELAAVIAAAVQAIGDEEGTRFVLRSFRPAGEGSTAWNRAGRHQAKHTYR